MEPNEPAPEHVQSAREGAELERRAQQARFDRVILGNTGHP